MIGRIIKNSSVNAKVHAKMCGMLKNEDYDHLISLKTVSRAAEFLRENTRFGEVLTELNLESVHRGQLEARLKLLLVRDLRSFLAFSKAGAGFFLNIFIMQNEISYIKQQLRRLKAGDRDRRPMRTDRELYNDESLTALSDVKSIDEFFKALEHSVYERPLRAYRENQGRQNLFEMEMSLDMYCRAGVYSLAAKHLTKDEEKAVVKIFGAQTDLENILFIIRAKKYYGFTPEMLYPYLASKGGRLKREEIKEMIDAQTDEAVLLAARKTCYGKLFSGELSHVESRVGEYILGLHKRAFYNNPYSIEATLYYIKARETEIKNIIMIIEGIRYGLDKETIKSYLIKTW